MTAVESITILCEEYKAEFYTPTGCIKPTIQMRIDWINKNIPKEKISEYTHKILENCKGEYLKAGQLPSIASMAELLKPDKDILEYEAEKMFNELLKKLDRYKGFVTDNPRLQAGLDSIGGWLALCDTLIVEQPFRRKRFVEIYTTVNPECVTLAKYHGLNTDGKTVFIGNENTLKIGGSKNNLVILSDVAKAKKAG